MREENERKNVASMFKYVDDTGTFDVVAPCKSACLFAFLSYLKE